MKKSIVFFFVFQFAQLGFVMYYLSMISKGFTTYPLCKVWSKRIIYRVNIEQAILCFSIFNNFWKGEDKILVFKWISMMILFRFNLKNCFLSTNCWFCFYTGIISNESQAFLFTLSPPFTRFLFPRSHIVSKIF